MFKLKYSEAEKLQAVSDDLYRCTGYRAVTVPGGLVQVPEARSIRCNLVALRRHSKANRKIADVRKPELRLS
jgi:xanthine dehydrogenase iron-sulfur cluster and FAD-binding subunit A